MARAHAAVDAAWAVLSEQIADPERVRERARLRLAYIVASLLHSGEKADGLAALAVVKFQETVDLDTLS